MINFDHNPEIVSKNGLYRIGVGAVIEKSGLIFCANRIDGANKGFGHFLQMPQGGVDDGENLYQAVLREVYEETGIVKNKLEFINHTKDWIYYDVPETFRNSINGKLGQAQIWFHFNFLGLDSNVNLNVSDFAEFSEFFWEKPEFIISKTIDFKKDLHTKVFTNLSLM